MTKTTNVRIEVSSAGLGFVEVDGCRVPKVQSVATQVSAGKPPVVSLTLAATDATEITYECATVAIAATQLPEAVEIALWRHLMTKYGNAIDVTTLESSAREWSIGRG